MEDVRENSLLLSILPAVVVILVLRVPESHLLRPLFESLILARLLFSEMLPSCFFFL